MRSRMTRLVLAATAVSMGPAVVAAAPQRPVNALVQRLTDCRAVADEAERLRCYDAAVTGLAEAAGSGAVVVMDREDVRRTRRTLFGFPLPRIGLFDGGEAEAREIRAKVSAVREVGYGRWRITLEDGAIWETTEAMNRPPTAGATATIRKASLGSYMLSVGSGRYVRARRIG